MTNLQVLGNLAEEGTKALLDYRISEGLEFMTALMVECDDRQLYNQANQLCDDYANMMRFMGQGGVDPQHNEIQENIIRTGLRTIDAAHRHIRAYQNLDKYGSTYNMIIQVHGRDAFSILKTLWDKLKDTPRRYDVENQIFYCLWTSGHFSPAQTALVYEFIASQDSLVQQHWTSALALSLWEYMDAEKMTLLAMLTASDDTQTRARALTGYVLALMKFADRIHLYPTHGQALINERAASEIVMVQKSLILSLRSEKANDKMEKDLLPNIMKIAQYDYERSKMGIMPRMEDKKRMKIMGEIHKLNSIGYDMTYRSFILASRNKFFQELAHWFSPFDEMRPEVYAAITDEKGETRKEIKFFLNGIPHCETDKYAFCFMIMQNMNSLKEMQINSMIPEEYELKKPSVEDNYRNVMQCLYRFYLVSPWKSEQKNPFELTPYLPDHDELRNFITDREMLETCKFLVEHEYYNRPIIYLDELIHKNGASEEALALMGRCYIGQENYIKALEQLTKAEILNDKNLTVLSNISQCYKALGRYDKQEEYLKRLVEMDAETFQTELALCFMSQGKYEEALKIFYQMEYEGKHVNMSMRSIAWCSLKIGKLETAERYYRKLMDLGEKTHWEDYLNAGHTAFIAGDWKLAKERYRTYIPLYMKEHPKDSTSGIAPFDADKQELMNHGINKADLNLMRDIVLSKNEA